MTLLSITASFGALVWIFQDGNLSERPRLHVARVHDRRQPDHHVQRPVRAVDGLRGPAAVADPGGLPPDRRQHGLGRRGPGQDGRRDHRRRADHGRVFSAFALAESITIKSIGVGMAIAVLIDATIIRVLLVPATMRLMGRWNWWAPGPLGRFADRLGFSHAEDEDTDDERRRGTTDRPARRPGLARPVDSRAMDDPTADHRSEPSDGPRLRAGAGAPTRSAGRACRGSAIFLRRVRRAPARRAGAARLPADSATSALLAAGLASLVVWVIRRGTVALYAGAFLTALALPGTIEALRPRPRAGLGNAVLRAGVPVHRRGPAVRGGGWAGRSSGAASCRPRGGRDRPAERRRDRLAADPRRDRGPAPRRGRARPDGIVRARPLLDDCERPDRHRPEAPDLRRDRVEPARRRAPTSASARTPRFVRCSTMGMPAARSALWTGRSPVGRPVDVQRVDPDDPRAARDEHGRGRAVEVRMSGRVGRRSEVAAPAGVEQDGMAGEVEAVEDVRPDLRCARSRRRGRSAGRRRHRARGRRGRSRRGSGGTACRDRCRCCRPCRSGRSGTRCPARTVPARPRGTGRPRSSAPGCPDRSRGRRGSRGSGRSAASCRSLGRFLDGVAERVDDARQLVVGDDERRPEQDRSPSTPFALPVPE